MHITGAIIKNFRCFKHLELNFETLNILIGENGSGKTAVLEALNYAFSLSFLASRIDEQDFNYSSNESIEVQVFLSESFIVNLSDGYTTRSIPCDKIYLNIKRREKASPNKALSDPYTITHHVLPDDSVPSTEIGKWHVSRDSGTEFKFTERQLSFPINSDDFPRVFYFNKQRISQADTGFNTTFNRIITEYNWRFVKNLENIKDDYEKSWNSINESLIKSIGKEKYQDTFLSFKEKLGRILCQNMDNFELSPINLRQPFSKSFFSIRDGIDQINFHGLGSGVSMLVSLLFLETISSLSGENIIFMIDEPEMHLHPQLQDRLFEYLDSLKTQILYSTHSNHLVRLKNWKSIIRFDDKKENYPKIDILENNLTYNGNENTIYNHLDDIKTYYQDKTIFLRENNDLFFARKCILVEGLGDRYAIEVLADFNLSEITIIPCYGKNKIFYYQLLCKAFGIPYFTLFDLDGLKKEIEPNLTIINAAVGDEYFHFDKSLECCFGISTDYHKGSKLMSAIDACEKVDGEMAEALEKIKSFVIGCNVEKSDILTTLDRFCETMLFRLPKTTLS